MKKIITTLFLATISTIGFSQSLRFLEHGTNTTAQAVYTINVDAAVGSVFYLDIQNLSANNLNLKIRKTTDFSQLSCGTPNDVTFCDPVNCYANPATNLGLAFPISAGQIIDPGANLYGLKADLAAGTCLGTYVVHYRVFNTASTADSAGVTLIYNVTPTAIPTIDSKSFVMSNALPNPVNTSALVKYDFPVTPSSASIKVYNMMGSFMKEIKLDGQDGKASIDVAALADGVYFYSLIVNDKPVATKRLLVSH